MWNRICQLDVKHLRLVSQDLVEHNGHRASPLFLLLLFYLIYSVLYLRCANTREMTAVVGFCLRHLISHYNTYVHTLGLIETTHKTVENCQWFISRPHHHYRDIRTGRRSTEYYCYYYFYHYYCMQWNALENFLNYEK